MRTLAIFAVFSALLTALTPASGEEPKAKKERPAPQGVLLMVPGYIMREGDEVQLFCCDARGRLLKVAVAEDWSTFGDVQKAIAANDTEGIAELVDGRHGVHLLASGTRVRVLKLPANAPPTSNLSDDPEYRNVEIRILDGPMAGKTGYVIYEYVRKCQMTYPKARKKSRR